MAAADPTSHSCKDTPGPGHSFRKAAWVAFISYLWDAHVLLPAQRRGRGRGTHSRPSSQLTGGLRNNTCMFTAGSPSSPDKCTDYQCCISAEGFHVHFLEGE